MDGIEHPEEKHFDVFRANIKAAQLNSCIINIEALVKLYDIFKEINQEALQYQIQSIKKDKFKTDEQKEKLIQHLSNIFKVTIQVNSDAGDLLVSQEREIFDSKNLPDQITFISIDNNSLYKHVLNEDPLHTAKVTFDLKKTSIFELLSSPSSATDNDSLLRVSGPNSTWVYGSFDRIQSLLSKRSTKRKWIHQKHIYDLYLWVIIVPLAFWNLYNYQEYLNISTFPPVFTVATYLYFFVIILFLAAIFFRYLRWLFPIIQLEENKFEKSILHRIVITGVILSIVANVLTLLVF